MDTFLRGDYGRSEQWYDCFGKCITIKSLKRNALLTARRKLRVTVDNRFNAPVYIIYIKALFIL